MSQKNLIKAARFAALAVAELSEHVEGEGTIEGLKLEAGATLLRLGAGGVVSPRAREVAKQKTEGEVKKPARAAKPAPVKVKVKARVGKAATKVAGKTKGKGKVQAVAVSEKTLPSVATILGALNGRASIAREDVDTLFPSRASASAALRHGKRVGSLVVNEDGSVSTTQ